MLTLLNFPNFSPERAETGNSSTTESEVLLGNSNVKVRKTNEHILHKIWHLLKFSKIPGKRAHPRANGKLAVKFP